ncbi:YCF48-related protein [Algoriphagus namhaensis]
MRKVLYLLITLCSLHFSSQAQTWTRMQSWGLDLEAIFWQNDSVGFLAGEKLIARTQDAGLTWREVDFLPENRLKDIAFVDESIALAVGENGYIIRSTDAGRNWVKINFSAPTDLHKLEFFDPSELYILGENGQIWESTDLGLNWSSSSTFPNAIIQDLYFVNSDTVFAAANSGQLFRSMDAGISWSPQNSGTDENINELLVRADGIGLAVGDAGLILRSTDFGSNWTKINSGVGNKLSSLATSPANPNISIAVGENATALRSTNGGQSWGRANLGNGNTRTLRTIKFLPNQGVAYAVGEVGYLISSTNGGGSWTTRLAGIRADLTDLDFKNDRSGLIGGDTGVFYATGNGATSLVSRPLPEPLDMVSIDFWNTSFGYVSGAGGKMYRTSNGGQSWVNVSANTPEQVNGFYLFAPSVAYVAGSSGYIARSFDSGGSWDSQVTTNTSEDLKDVTFFDFQVGFAMGANGQISWSNGGNVWENIPKLTDENLNALAKVDSSTAIVVGDKGIILKGEDKARNWRKIEVPFQEKINDVDFWDDQLGMAVGDNGFTIQTKDGGETWVQIPSGTRANLNSVSIGTPLVAFAAGDEGTLLRYNCIPPGALSEIAGPAASCLSVQEYHIDEPSIEGAQIQWRVDGGKILSGQGTSRIQVIWESAGRNAVLVSNENFCGNGETSALEVLVSDLPADDLAIQGNGSSCISSSEVYAYPTLEGVVYRWEANGGVLVSGQGTSQVEILWEVEGLREVSLFLSNTCGESEKVSLPVQVNSAPGKAENISGEALVGLGEAMYEVENVPGVNYTWTIPAGAGRILSGQGKAQVLVDWESEGNFTIRVTPRNECGAGLSTELAVEVNVITSLEPKPDISLRIYPNPSQGKLFIEATDLAQWNTMELMDASGSILREVQIKPGLKRIELENLSKGIFLIRLANSREMLIRKVMVY